MRTGAQRTRACLLSFLHFFRKPTKPIPHTEIRTKCPPLLSRLCLSFGNLIKRCDKYRILVRFEIRCLRRLISNKGKTYGFLRPKIRRDSGPTPITRGSSGAKDPPLAMHVEQKTPRSQTLTPQGSRKGGEKQTGKDKRVPNTIPTLFLPE